MSQIFKKLLKFSAIFFIAGFLFFAHASDAFAATKYWSGTGTWNAANTNWGTAPGGPYNTTFDTGDDAVFEGTAGTVTLSSQNQPLSITFNVTGYTISSGTITGTSAPLVISSSVDAATITSVIGGTTVEKVGSGLLILSASNTFSTGITIKNGSISCQASATCAGAGTITIGDTTGTNSATLYNDAGGFSISRPIVLATNATAGTLAIGISSAAGGGVIFSGGITGTNNLTILNNNAASTLTISTTSINNVGTVTNAGTGAAPVTVTTVIGTNVTGLIQNSSTSNINLNGTNTYTGPTTIKAGTAVANAITTSFGNGGTITVGDSTGSADATLSNGGSVTVVNPITIASGSSGTKKITASGAAAIFSGAITLNTDLTIDAAVGTLTISGGITGTGNVTLFSSGGGVTVSTNAINNTGTITNSGTSAGANNITIGVGANVTQIIQASTNATLGISGAITVGASGKTLQNTLGTRAMTVTGGTTGTGNFILSNNSTLTAGITFTTGSVNHIGTITNQGTGTGTVTITSVIGTSVSGVTQNSTTSALGLSGVNTFNSGTGLTIKAGTLNCTGAATCAGAQNINLGDTTGSNSASFLVGTTALNITRPIILATNPTAGTLKIGKGASIAALTFSGGITGTNNITIDNSAGTGTITVSTAAVNNVGTVTNIGASTGTTTISAAIGTNVTALIENSTTSAFTVSGALTVGATGKIFRNSSGTKILTISGGVTGTGDVVLDNDSALNAGVTVSAKTMNHTGTITNSGSGAGTASITFAIGANVTNVIQNSTTSALNLSKVNTNQQLAIYAGTVNCIKVATCAGSGNITLGNTTGSDSASFLVSTTGLTIARPIVLATNATAGTLTVGTASAIAALTFTGGVTGTNNLTINAGSTTGSVTFSTGAINNAGTVTINDSSSSGSSTISSVIGSNVTNVSYSNTSSGSMTFSGANTFTGNFTLKRGTAIAGVGNVTTVSGPFGPSARGITLGDASGNSASLIVGTFTISNDITLGTNAVGTLTIGSSTTTSAPTFSGAIGLNGSNVTLSKQGTSGTATFSGPISGTGNLTLTNTAATSSLLTVTGGITNVGNVTITNNTSTTGNITIATNSINNTGTITNNGTAGSSSTISAGVGANVTTIVNSSASNSLIISGAITVNATATTVQNTVFGAASIGLSGGTIGTGNLILKNDSTASNLFSITSGALNHTGTITNSASGAGGDIAIAAPIGTNVTEIIENSAVSALTLQGATTVGAAGKIFRNSNSSGSSLLTITGGVTGTGDVTFDNDSAISAGITVSSAALNNTGTITNNGSGAGDTTISFSIGSNVTNLIQNSTTSALNLSTSNSNQQLTIKAGTVNVSSNGSAVGDGNITLGDTTGSNSAALLIGSSLTITRPIVLATNASAGTLTVGNSGAGISAVFSGGVTGTNNLTINENGTTGTVTFSTASINNAGTVTNIGAGSGTTTISGGIGANVTQVISNSTTSALAIGTTAITVNSSSTTLKNSAGTTVLTVTGGVSGTGNLILSNDSSTNDGISITTTSVNNTGTVTNQGSGSGTATISAIIGTNVTGVTQNSTTSSFNLSGVNTFNSGTGLSIKAGTVNCTTSASCVGAGDINLGDTSGSNAASLLIGSSLTIARPIILATNASVGTLTLGNSGAGVSAVFSGGVTGTNNFTINENGTTGTVTFSTATINNVGTVTNIGAGSGTTTIIVGSNVTGVTENSATSTLAFGATGDIAGPLTLTQGTITDGGYSLSMASFSSSNTNTRTLTMGSATVWTLTGTGTVWDTGTTTNLTLTPSTSTIKLTDSSSSSKTFAGGGKTFNNLWLAGGTGTGAYTISGSNTFADFKDDGTGAHNVNFTAGSTTTITSLTLDTTGPDLITLASTTPTTQWNLVDTAGTNTVQYVSITDSCASGGATWVSTDSSNVNGGNNCGWSTPILTVSGTANGNNGATVRLAINGSIDAQTTTIASSTWSITNISSLSAGDIITVWADGVTDANETTAVTKYISGALISGMVLNTNVLTIGSNQNSSVSVTNMGLYDADSDEDIMHTSNSGALLVQGASNTYTGEILSILPQNTLTVTSASTETVNTEKIDDAGTITSVGSPTYTLTGTSGTLFTLSGVFTPATSEVIVTSASGTPTLLSSGTTFHKLTINADATVINAGSTITMSSADASNRLYVQKGVLNDGGNQITGTANGTLVMNPGASLCLSGTPASTTATCDSGATPTSTTTFPTNYINGNITFSSNGYYRAITIDHTKVPNTNQTDFPVLISGTYSYLKTAANGGLVQNANGYDIGFYSDSALTTKLSWETERYIATTGEVIYWVKVPTLATATDTTIYMGYGNTTITTDQSSPTSVWNSAFKGVYHLPDGTTLAALDSTSNGYNGTITSATAITGQVGGGANFDGSGQKVAMTTMPSYTSAFTAGGWVKSNGTQEIYGGTIIGKRSMCANSTTDFPFDIAFDAGAAGAITAAFDSGNNFSYDASIAATLNNSTTTWHYVVATFTANGTSYLYVDGAQAGFVATNFTLASATSPWAIGTSTVGNSCGTGGKLLGQLDEMRVSNVARSADWITTEYNNQSSPSTFYSVGSEIVYSSSVYYNADAATTVSATPTYGNLKFQPVLTSNRIFTLDSGLTVAGALTSNPSGAYALTANVGSSGLTTGATILSGASSSTTTLDTTASNYAVSSGSISIASGSTFNARSSTVNLTGNSTVFSNNGTFTGNASTIKLTDATSIDKTFAGGGATFGTLQLTGAGTGSFIITGSNTFNKFLVDTPPHTVKFAAGTTQTVNNYWNVTGTAGNLITLNSTINGTKWNLSMPANNSGIFSDYVSLRDSAAAGGATFYAGSSSVDDTTGGSTNTGWTFLLRVQGGGGGNVESSATPDAQVGGGGQNGGGGVESGGNPDAGQGGGGQGGGGGDLGFLNIYRGSMLASVGSFNLFSILKHIFF